MVLAQYVVKRSTKTLKNHHMLIFRIASVSFTVYLKPVQSPLKSMLHKQHFIRDSTACRNGNNKILFFLGTVAAMYRNEMGASSSSSSSGTNTSYSTPHISQPSSRSTASSVRRTRSLTRRQQQPQPPPPQSTNERMRDDDGNIDYEFD